MKTLTKQHIDELKARSLKYGYPECPKWVQFAEAAIKDGWEVKLYRARTTLSKYLFICKGAEQYKIRYSNHRPSYLKEEVADSDFYVGVHHKGCITTEELMKKLGISQPKQGA
jgi:hypothetical protein